MTAPTAADITETMTKLSVHPKPVDASEKKRKKILSISLKKCLVYF